MSIKSNHSVAAQVLLWADVEHTKSLRRSPAITNPVFVSHSLSFSQAALFRHPSISSCLPVWLHRVLFGNLLNFFSFLVAAATCELSSNTGRGETEVALGKVCSLCQKNAPMRILMQIGVETVVLISLPWSNNAGLLFQQVQPSPLTSYPGQLVTLLLILNSLSALTLAGS